MAESEPERLVSASRAEEEQNFELKLRPRWLREFIGQSKAKEQLHIALEAAKSRGEALAVLRETRQRVSGMLAEQAREHDERWAGADREEAERAAAFEARHAESVARAEVALSEAKRALAATEESARRCQEEARARAAEILAEAHLREDRIARETEQVLRDHGETWDDVRAELDHVRSSLTTLTARAALE